MTVLQSGPLKGVSVKIIGGDERCVKVELEMVDGRTVVATLPRHHLTPFTPASPHPTMAM